MSSTLSSAVSSDAPPSPHEVPRRETIGAVVRVASGNFLEMYDFIVYGYYATYIGKTFFPAGSEFASLMLSLMTFGVGYLMRPIGSGGARRLYRSRRPPARTHRDPRADGDRQIPPSRPLRDTRRSDSSRRSSLSSGVSSRGCRRAWSSAACRCISPRSLRRDTVVSTARGSRRANSSRWFLPRSSASR